MNSIVFEILKCVIVVAIILIARYAMPFFKQYAESDKMSGVTQWVESAVLYAQQVYWGKSGAERKEIVLKFLKETLDKTHVQITDEQLDVLIEAAVKAMKMKENAGAVLEEK